ncbi:MAG: HAD hydrolase-like protein [Thomasclavelia sp.]|nr:HAD hydrolase-like protein [Thomasclavelia sp.]
MINNLKGVIFDFNGTLFFDNDKHVKAWGAISNQIRGHGISQNELHSKFNGVPNNEIIKYMKPDATTEDLKKYSSLKEEYYRKFCFEDKPSFHLVKGSEQYFDKLTQEKIPFTIASASIKPNIDFFIESFNLDHWIKPENIIYDDGSYDNKVKMFKEAAKVINCDLKDILIIEDSVSGIKNAYKAGCQNIIVVDSANKKDEYQKLPGVIKVINDFTQI